MIVGELTHDREMVRNVRYESLWDNLGMSDIKVNSVLLPEQMLETLWDNLGMSDIRPKFFFCYDALSRPTVKCEKTGCQIWAKNLLKFVFNGLKKHLHDLYMRFDCIPPEFSPFRNFKKNIGKLNSLTVRKTKKQQKIPTDRPNFQILVG